MDGFEGILESVTEYLGYGMWGVLGFLGIAIIGGMIFGMVRGWKRTLKRMIVLIPCMLGSIFLAPLITGLVAGSPLGGMLDELVEGFVGSLPFVGAIDDSVFAFVLSVPLIVVNIMLFYILVFCFRFIITPIFSAIFLRKIAPKKDKAGNKIKHSKLAGLGLGALFGVIIFAFMWMPFTGFMSSLDRINKYEPQVYAVAEVSMTDTGIPVLDTVNQAVSSANEGINGSVPGMIVGNPVMKFVGDLGLGYLTTIKAGNQRVSMQREIEVYFELTRDAVVIYNLAVNIENPREDLALVFDDPRNVEYFESIINKMFGLAPILAVLDSDLTGFLEYNERQILNSLPLGMIVGEDEELQERFGDALIKAVDNFDTDFVKEDFLAVLEVARLVFSSHQIAPNINANLWARIDDVLDVVTRGGVGQAERAVAFARLHEVLVFEHEDWDGLNLIEQIFDILGTLNTFESFLFDSENTDLYTLPAANFIGAFAPLAPEDVVLDFSRVMGGFANIITRTVDIGPTVFRLVSTGGDIVGIANILGENDGAAIGAVGEILEILTNHNNWEVGANKAPTMGTSVVVRKVLSGFLDGVNFGGGGIVDFESVIGPLKEKLAPDGPNIKWGEELTALVKVIQELAPFLTGQLNPDDIINQLLGGGLLETIAESDLLSGLVVGMLDGAINNATPEGITFNFDDANNGDVIRALGGMTEDMTKLLTDLDNVDADNFDNIIGLFGGGDDGEDTLLKLAESGLKIEIDSDKFPDLEDSLKLWEGALVDCADCNDAIGGCQECEDGIEENPLRKILGMFVFNEADDDGDTD